MSRRSTKQLSTEEYCLSLAGDVATKGIKIALGDIKNMSLSPTNMFEIPLYAESDGRIKNRVYTMLHDIGVLSMFNYTQQSRFSYYNSSRKEPKNYYGMVSSEWFNKNAPAMAKAPVFETSGRITTSANTWSTQTEVKLVKEKDNYRNLFGHNLTDAEMIYIYFHIDEYDVQVREEKNNSNRFGSTTHTTYHVYPKALLPMLSKGVFYGHAMDYLEKHFEWVIANVLGIKDKIINKVGLSELPSPTFKMEDKTKWNEEFVTKQIDRINKLETMLGLGKLALLKLNASVLKFGGWDKVKEVSEKAFIKYLEENFPMHISDDEKDEALKDLCLAVQEGKNKGFNERFQAITKED